MAEATTNGTNGVNGHPSSALCSVDEFVSRSYDYVIVGGGTAGLVVAARLSENPDVTVGVLEAGANRMDDKQVSTPGLYPTLIGREKYDWCMTSTPQVRHHPSPHTPRSRCTDILQPDAGNKVYSMPRGKLLGGSSGINYLMYVRGSRADYDGWAALGNPGWSWDELMPYFRKHQTLDAPSEIKSGADPRFMPHAARDRYHGDSGPIHTSFNDFYMPIEEDFVKAAYEVGGTENTLVDAWSGDHMGFYSSLGAVDRTNDKGNRSYAATGYLRPNLGRPNLRVLTEAQATRILLRGDEATGVEFLHGGKTYRVEASREVILSTGVIQTPQLLELSGIGDPDVLREADVECVVENKSVGANFQDHVLGGMLFDLAPGVLSMDALHGEEYQKAQQEIYEKSQNGIYGSPGMLMGFLSYASIVSKEELDSTIAEVKKNSLAKTKFEKAQEEVSNHDPLLRCQNY